MASESHPSISSQEEPSSTPGARRSAVLIPRPLLWIAGVVLAWFLVSEGATEAWYRWKESQVSVTEPWAINWPTEEDAAKRGFRNFRSAEMGSVEQEILQFDNAVSGHWRDENGYQWTAFMLEWQPDKRLNNIDFAHNPTVCLPAAGLTLVKDLPRVAATSGGATLVFNAWEFSASGQPVFVFTAVRRDREFDQQQHLDNRRLERLNRVGGGVRGNALQSLQFVVIGPSKASQATELVEGMLSRLMANTP